MRKLLLAALLSVPMIGVAQSQRLVLLEHFTQASCGPCGTFDPDINAILEAKTDQIIAIKYQTSWPGVDPMNADNPSEVLSRVRYYQITSVPNSSIDGKKPGSGASAGHPAYWNADTVDAHSSVAAQFTMHSAHRLKTARGIDSIIAYITVKKTGAVGAGAITLMVAATEKEILWERAPGNNGEKKFEMVFKKFLPNAQGIIIPSTMAIGDSLKVRVAGRPGYITTPASELQPSYRTQPPREYTRHPTARHHHCKYPTLPKQLKTLWSPLGLATRALHASG